MTPLMPNRTPIPPKKKTRHGITRQNFALPAIQQFEPVLVTSARSYMPPRVVTPKDESQRKWTSVESLDSVQPVMRGGCDSISQICTPSPRQLHTQRKANESISPRAHRPQPPPVGISSRTDLDIYRYSQGAKQRMTIRPLFEQRREEEAAMASQLLSKRREGGRGMDHGESNDAMDNEGPDLDLPGDAKGVEEESTCGTFMAPSCIYNEAKYNSSTSEKSIESSTGDEQSEINNDALPSKIKAIGKDHVDAAEQEQAYDINTNQDSFNPDKSELMNPALTQPLNPPRCYEAFLAKESRKLSFLRNSTIMKPINAPCSIPHQSNQSTTEVNEPHHPIYKVLWRDTRTFSTLQTTIVVLLSSEGTGHISIADTSTTYHNASYELHRKWSIDISNDNLTQSKQIRPNLAVLTPKWAEWIISKIRVDGDNNFFLQLEDPEIVEKLCCYSKQVHTSGVDLMVTMFVLNGTELLVAAHNMESDEQCEVSLKHIELLRLARAFGRIQCSDDSLSVESLVSDESFLDLIATNSKIIKMGMQLGRQCDQIEDGSLRDDHEASEFDASVKQAVSGQKELDDIESRGLAHPCTEIHNLLRSNTSLFMLGYFVHVYTEDAVLSTLRHLQQKEAVHIYAGACLDQATNAAMEEIFFQERIKDNVEAAKLAKLKEIAITSILDDMINNFIAHECRLELHDAKYSGGYADYYASKVQATYRMSTQWKEYERKKHVRLRAVCILQALQRGIIARRRYCELRIEREQYLFYGFLSSLHQTTSKIEDPGQRALELTKERERRQQHFLMNVLHGYASEHGFPTPFRVPSHVVQQLFNEYGVIVGCSTELGNTVTEYLHQISSDVASNTSNTNDRVVKYRTFTSSEINAALLLGLRSQYNDTFGLSTYARSVDAAINSSSKSASASALPDGTAIPPRWLLKISSPFQQTNRDRLASLRLARKNAGRKASHLVAREYRNLLATTFSSFESCRVIWETSISSRLKHARTLNEFSQAELIQYCLDLLVSCVKDWGIDPDPLFEALNVCYQHRHGKAVVGVVESKFNEYADGVNQMHNKQNILSLREEISQELENFEKLLALRCLNIAHDHIVPIPASELLHIVLHGIVNDEYTRHALPFVLPITSITEKYQLARKMIHAYANDSYGEAFNTICWSCLDTAENVTVEAAQFVDRITRIADGDMTEDGAREENSKNDQQAVTVASRALYLLTGFQAVKFLQFLVKVAHFNKPIQRRVLLQLEPYAKQYEMYRLASTICTLADFNVVTQLFQHCFAASAIYSSTPFWKQYEALFNQEQAMQARKSEDKSNKDSADMSAGNPGGYDAKTDPVEP